MKLERLHESVLPTVAVMSGLALAVLAGSFAGTGNTKMIGVLIGGIMAIAFFLVIRQRVWMLIPACYMLGGKISILPLPFTISQLAILFAFGTFLLLKAFKIVRLKPTLGIVEVWMMVMLAYLATVFLRNPVGMEALGSTRVGGRPYFEVAVACAGFWVLSRAVASTREAFFIPLLIVGGNGFHALVNAIAYRFPFTVGPLAKLYSGIAAAENPDALPPLPGEGSRLAYLQGIGSTTFLAACSYWRPFTVINPIYFWRFLVFVFAAYAVLQSGFRSVLFGMILTFLLSTYFRRGAAEVVRGAAIGAVGLGLLLMMQGTLFSLPLSAQRALSFLPGKWDYAAKNDAKGSTEWRMEMWKAMLTGDKYIANKWLGDGFGFTRHQLEIMNANMRTGSTADQQENLLINGGVHSGPVTAIRYVGYVGLTLFLVLLVMVARRAVRLIRRAEGTPFYPLALFLGVPSAMAPFTYVFIFGAFDGDFPGTIIAIGLQKMLENSLDAYEASQKKEASPATPLIPKFRRPRQFVPVR